ncbi:MAG: lysostaphin resistance A-like protein [bacterium]
MTLTRISQAVALVLAALTFWVLISRPEDSSVTGMTILDAWVLALLVSIVFGLSFLGLRLATSGSITYWSGRTGAKQIWRLGLMIFVTLAIQIIAGRVLDYYRLLGPETSSVVFLVTWTLIPAAFLLAGLVKWPERLRSASTIRLVLAGLVAVCFAGSYSYYSFVSGEPNIPSTDVLSIMIVDLIFGATVEEIVLRVLLLTASRFQAVFLSGVIFAGIHAPLALVGSAVHGGWSMLQQAANAYAPDFLLQTMLGMVLGALWLRTGSIWLVVLTHAIFNLGPTLAYGFPLTLPAPT